MLTVESFSSNFWTDFLNLLLEKDDFLLFLSTVILENVFSLKCLWKTMIIKPL